MVKEATETGAAGAPPARRRAKARSASLPAGIHRVLDARGHQVYEQAEHGDPLPKWRIRVYDRRTKTQPEWTIAATLEDAEAFLADRKRERNHSPAALTLPRMRAVDYLPRHLEKYAFKNDGTRRPLSTWSKHRAMLETYLLPALGDNVFMANITTAMLDEAIRNLRKRPTKKKLAAGEPGDPVSAWTKATVAGSAKAFFNAARRDGIIRHDPAKDLAAAWGQGHKVIIPSVTEVELLADAMNEVWPAVLGGEIVRLFAYAGPRMEELVALHADRVYPVDCKARITRIATESGGRREWRSADADDVGSDVNALKSKNAVRDIALSERALAAATKLQIRRRKLATADPDRDVTRNRRQASAGATRRRTYIPAEEDRWKLLVTNELGGPLSYSVWRRKLKAAQKLLAERGTPVQYTAHDLRHVCASLLIAAGATPDEVRNQMGHASEAFTRRVYGHLWPTDLTDLARKLDRKIASLTEAEADQVRRAANDRHGDAWGLE